MTCKTTMIKVNKEKKTYFENIQFATWEQYSTRSRECSSQKLEISRWNLRGQIKSEWIYEIINFPKIDPKNLKDFCPMYYKNSHGRNPSNFWGQFLEIDDFINSFWFYLTSKVPSRNLQLLTRTLPGSSWIEAGPKLYHLSIFRIFEQKICFSLLLRQFLAIF